MKEELLQEAPKPKMDSEGVRLLPDGSDGQPLDPADALASCVSSSAWGGRGPALSAGPGEGLSAGPNRPALPPAGWDQQ